MRMENPLTGRFNRERTLLVFRQRSIEAQAAFWSMLGGSALFVYGVYQDWLDRGMAWWCIVFGLAFAGAGTWAYLLFRMIRFDLRKRSYVERSGSGLWIKWRQGSIDEINCLGLESYHGLLPEAQLGPVGWHVGGPGVAQSQASYAGKVFVVRLWWKDRGRYPPVVEHLFANRASGLGLDHSAATFYTLAQSYAHALNVPLYGDGGT